MREREQVMAEMLHHVLSRCRRCHRRRPCPEYAELEAEYDSFRKGEHEMNEEKKKPDKHLGSMCRKGHHDACSASCLEMNESKEHVVQVPCECDCHNKPKYEPELETES